MTMMTAHAAMRMHGRRICADDIETMLVWGREVPVGGRAWSVTLSRQTAAELAAEGTPRAQIDVLRRLSVVVAADGKVITAMRMWRPEQSHRYRRGLR